jgi:hypothetical protein
MALNKRFRCRARKKSLAAAAFEKEKETSSSGQGSGSGDESGAGKLFVKRKLRARRKDGAELTLLAQLGDRDAIQDLQGTGLDGKDHLGLSSLATMAMSGDMDAVRLLGNRGFSLTKKSPIFLVPPQQNGNGG